MKKLLMMRREAGVALGLVISLGASGCVGMTVGMTAPVVKIASGAFNRESDIDFAREASPAQIKTAEARARAGRVRPRAATPLPHFKPRCGRCKHDPRVAVGRRGGPPQDEGGGGSGAAPPENAVRRGVGGEGARRGLDLTRGRLAREVDVG